MLKLKYFLTFLFLIPVMCFAQQAVVAQDVVAEDIEQEVDLQALIQQCEGCHGPNGNSTRDDVPVLAGKPVSKIEESIAQFYYYERHCPTKTPTHEGRDGNPMDMCAIANSLSKAEIQALAQYFATQ